MGGNPWGGIKLKDITNQCTFSWYTEFDEITHGSIDSIHDGNMDTYCGGHTDIVGAGILGRLKITLPSEKLILPIWKIKAGAQIGADACARYLNLRFGDDIFDGASYRTGYLVSTKYSCLFAAHAGNPVGFCSEFSLSASSAAAGDYAIEFYEVRALELVGV